MDAISIIRFLSWVDGVDWVDPNFGTEVLGTSEKLRINFEQADAFGTERY